MISPWYQHYPGPGDSASQFQPLNFAQLMHKQNISEYIYKKWNIICYSYIFIYNYIYLYIIVMIMCTIMYIYIYVMFLSYDMDMEFGNIIHVYHLKLRKIPVWDAATRLSRAPRPTLHLLRMEDLEAASLAAKAKTGPDIQQVLEANAERAAAIGLEPWRWPFWWPQPRILLSPNIYIYV